MSSHSSRSCMNKRQVHWSDKVPLFSPMRFTMFFIVQMPPCSDDDGCIVLCFYSHTCTNMATHVHMLKVNITERYSVHGQLK